MQKKNYLLLPGYTDLFCRWIYQLTSKYEALWFDEETPLLSIFCVCVCVFVCVLYACMLCTVILSWFVDKQVISKALQTGTLIKEDIESKPEKVPTLSSMKMLICAWYVPIFLLMHGCCWRKLSRPKRRRLFGHAQAVIMTSSRKPLPVILVCVGMILDVLVSREDPKRSTGFVDDVTLNAHNQLSLLLYIILLSYGTLIAVAFLLNIE